MSINKKVKLSKAQKSYLHAIGLSSDAILLYELLLHKGSLTAQGAASYTGHFPSAEYRLFYELEALGLVRRKGGRPRVFESLALPTGLSASLNLRQNELRGLLAQSLPKLAESTPEAPRLLIGRQALYSEYAKLAAKAHHTIDIFAIGIAYNPELVATQRSAVKRGVRIRHAVQQLKPSNYHVVHTWQRLGVKVRLAPQERGFHLMLFDDELALVSFSTPQNTDDRLSLVLDNPTAVRLFAANFALIWDEAREIAL